MLCVIVLCAQKLASRVVVPMLGATEISSAGSHTDHVDDGTVGQERGVGAAAAGGCREGGPTHDTSSGSDKHRSWSGGSGRLHAQGKRTSKQHSNKSGTAAAAGRRDGGPE